MSTPRARTHGATSPGGGSLAPRHDRGARIAAHTLWGLPDPDTSSNSSNNTVRSELGPDSDAPPGKRQHLGLVDDGDDDGGLHPSAAWADRTPAAVYETDGKGRGAAYQPELPENGRLNAKLERFGLHPDEVRVLDDSCSSGRSAELREDTTKEDALQVACAIPTLQHCVGRYTLSDRRVHGRPVWQRDGGSYWLYAGDDFHWYVSDGCASDCDLQGVSSVIRSACASGTDLPSKMAEWSWWDGTSWHADPTINIQEAPVGRGDRRSSSSSVQPRAGATLAFPSAGSQNHHLGTCKPCAWYWAHGCTTGASCSFCHLCPEGEVKRRRQIRCKEIKESKRENRRERQRVAAEAAEGQGKQTRLWL